MGQEIWLYPDPVQIPKVKEYVKLLGKRVDDYNYIDGPDFDGWEMNCWIEWTTVDPEWESDTEEYSFEGMDEFLEIGYQSHHYKGDFAECIAWEIKKRFTILKVGWDSIGWSTQFWDNEPFDFQIKMRQKTLKKDLSDEMRRDFEEEIVMIKKIKEGCMGFAKELFLKADQLLKN